MKRVVKTYPYSTGLSATFRQWRARSHCRFIHGYALEVSLTFQCEDDEVDENGWVINFGGLKPVKQWLEETFDHKTLVAQDDPALGTFEALNQGSWRGNPRKIGESTFSDLPLIQLKVVKRTGCEGFAEMIFDTVSAMLKEGLLGPTKAKLVEVKVSEHTGNSAIHMALPSKVASSLEVQIGGASGFNNVQLAQLSGLISQAIERREASRQRTGI